MLQYNLTPSSKSQYNIVLQYKLSPQAFFSTIQFCVLQYNASTTSPSHVTIQCLGLQYNCLAIQLSCNTIALPYNCLAIQLFSHNTIFLPMLQYNLTPPAIQKWYCNTIFTTIFFIFYFFSSPLSCNTKPSLQYTNFLFHNIIWAVAQINFLHFFSSFFFFISSYWKMPKKYISHFFFSHAIGKIPKNISILFFFSFLPANGPTDHFG